MHTTTNGTPPAEPEPEPAEQSRACHQAAAIEEIVKGNIDQHHAAAMEDIVKGNLAQHQAAAMNEIVAPSDVTAPASVPFCVDANAPAALEMSCDDDVAGNKKNADCEAKAESELGRDVVSISDSDSDSLSEWQERWLEDQRCQRYIAAHRGNVISRKSDEVLLPMLELNAPRNPFSCRFVDDPIIQIRKRRAAEMLSGTDEGSALLVDDAEESDEDSGF
eukprot:GEMP01055526.1.p1 GENE.GEMP01055526.1~~GEMP01055526.1.p1  ORF type:complete len:231 (+),score=49.60 GEMP01055526.1:36-695(+)